MTPNIVGSPSPEWMDRLGKALACESLDVHTHEIAEAQASFDAACHMEGVLQDALNIVRDDKRESFQKLMDLKRKAFEQMERA